VKKILILSAGFGEGHNTAARGVRDALARISPESKVEIRDLFAEAYRGLNEQVRRAYLGLINRWPRSWGLVYRWLDRKKDFPADFARFKRLRAHLTALLDQFQPDAVVSTFPAYPYFLNAIKGNATPPRNVVVVTDSITVNAIWCQAPGDYFILPNEQSAVVARQRGMPADRIRVLGFPVNPKFADFPTKNATAPNSPPRVLYMVNAGTRTAPDIVKRLLGQNVDLTVTVGRDQKLRAEIERISTGSKPEIIGWTDQMPRLLSESDILIGKAGGATVQETIAAACPMIINHVVAGQEEGNAQLILETKSGARARSAAEVETHVAQAFAHDGLVWRTWQNNIARLSRPRAALEIAEFLLGL
jgi:processive 1,2-diacylglycerol beta-glucosyltransferase